MKKLLMACCVASVLVSTSVLADARSDLQERLGKVGSFHAGFSQSVTSSDGAAVQDAAGELWVKRPNLFRWHTVTPDESLLVSDGETLWFYNPFVEQVTANTLNSVTTNTPFILIARNDPRDWSQYDIKQTGDNFHLLPKGDSGNLKQFDINVTKSGTITSFAAVEQDGQRSSYVLKDQNNSFIDSATFNFTPPKGVTVDDQRQ